MSNIPANPMLRKSNFGYYQVYCGNVLKLQQLCKKIGKSIDSVIFNKNFGVYEFCCESDLEKNEIDKLFGDKSILSI